MKCCVPDENQNEIADIFLYGLTERGDVSATAVEPDAAAVSCPGMGMGSGEILRLFIFAGSSCAPQFCQEKPHTYSMRIMNK